jgi:hypothetical protein
MKQLNWIESGGGPLILIAGDAFKLWSGTYKREFYLNGVFEEAEDFMNPEEADYGLACSVDDYLGLVDVANQNALVFGDQPMSTTVFYHSFTEAGIARWFYGDEKSKENLLNLDLNTIDWKFVLNIYFDSHVQYLFDSACCAGDFDKQERKKEFLLLMLRAGNYKVFTAVYEPDDKTRFFLYRFQIDLN